MILGILVFLVVDVRILLFLFPQDLVESTNERGPVICLVHSVHYLFPHPFFNLRILNFQTVLINFGLALVWIAFALNLFEHLKQLVLHMHLHVSKIFVTLVFKDLCK